MGIVAARIGDFDLRAYDDPTELAVRDRPFQVGAGLFGLFTVGVLAYFRVFAPAS